VTSTASSQVVSRTRPSTTGYSSLRLYLSLGTSIRTLALSDGSAGPFGPVCVPGWDLAVDLEIGAFFGKSARVECRMNPRRFFLFIQEEASR
jgi:hypothetical protein